MGLSLLEEARALPPVTARTCDVQAAIKAHPALADQIGELVSARDVPASVAERILNKRDIRIKSNTVGRHRRNDCGHCKDLGVTW